MDVSLGVEQGVVKAVFLFADSKGESIFLPFFPSRSCLHSMFTALLHCQSQLWSVKTFLHCISLTLILLPHSSTFRDTYDYIGPTWIIQVIFLSESSVDLPILVSTAI